MATDIGRVRAARSGIMAVTFPGKETTLTLSALDALELAIVDARAKEREVSAREDVKPLSVLRCAADYRDAPHGTKVTKRGLSGWWRKVDGAWIDESGAVMPNSPVSTSPRKVLEWGGA